MKATLRKYILLLLTLAAALVLTGCYMEQDDTTTGGANMADANKLPFETVAVPTATPTASPTPTPTQTMVGGNNIDQVIWDSDALDQNLPTPTPGSGNFVTMPPSISTGLSGVGIPTQEPTRTASAPVNNESNASGVLKAGSEGSNVKEVQQRLKDLKFYNSSVDGKYGAGTTNAVKAFQSTNGLTSDGIVGKQTKDALFSYNAIANSGTGSSATQKPVARATATPRPTATPNYDKARYLKVGMSGADVRQVQNRLIELGYLTGKADGDYGTATETAVKTFQKTNGVYDDGIAGKDTQKSLFSSSAKKAGGAVASIGGTLELNSEGDAVRALQNRLVKLKYMSGYSDGSYGQNTKTAVEAFQKNNGLTVDGKAGSATLAKLYADSAVDANGKGGSGSTPSGNSNEASTGYTVLVDGDTGEPVKKLQNRLKALGYYSGSIDGAYGPGTIAAIRAFQSQMKLSVDGKAGPATQRALYGENAKNEDTSKPLELGKEGSDVTKLQYALYELGYYQATVNGLYTQDTSNAVREFQMNNGLTADGKAGSQTLSMLYSPYAKPSAVETPNYVMVQMGNSGEDVVQVQSALYELGYSTRPATAQFDQDTFDAVKAFQLRHGLSADGVAGVETQQRLFAPDAMKAK